MHRIIHRHILLPAFDTLYHGRKTFSYLKELDRSQWLSREEVEVDQLRSLKRILEHAFANCPYYREAWTRSGLDPLGVKSLEDFRRWPTINRTTILESRTQMRASMGLKLISKATGGSSGQPLGFDLDTGSNDHRVAASYRGYSWAGAGPGAKLLYLWGVPLGKQSRLKRWKDRFYHGLHRHRILNTFELTEARAGDFLAEHNRYRPDVLVAYTNPLYEFARMLEQRGLRPFSPKAIIVGAEKLHGFQRELIEKIFGTRVFETYGSREFMLIAAECDRHEGLHLSHENLLVEVLDDDGSPTSDGQEGNIVITDLFNYGMPFIRYVCGDRCVAGWTKCSCGRGLPLMKPVLGRRLDTLCTPDGRRVPGELFPHMIKDFPGVKRFQVVQDQPDHVELRVIVGPKWSEADRAAVERLSKDALGPAVRFEIVRVDDIPLTGAGKLRVVINLCQNVATVAPAGR
jgi:phenylacetate-CoA ligase